jgi:DNA-binding response OmpR family regulator
MAGTLSLPRILIVDDTRTNIAILVETLREGYRLAVAPSGAKALEFVAKTPPDLVLLDIMMPEMDGYEVCRRLKAEPRTQGIPVIFITALDEVQEKTRGFALGAVDYITKPFEAAEVKARVRTHLQIEQYKRDLETRNQALQEAQARLQHQVRELEGRDRLVRAQMSVSTIAEACREVLQVTGQVLGVSQAAVYRPGEKGLRLELAATLVQEQLPGSVAAGDRSSSIAWAYGELQAHSIDKKEVAVPLLYRGKPLGVLWISELPAAQVGRAVLLSTLERLAQEAALVLHAAQLATDLASGDLQVAELLILGEEDTT